MSSTHAPHAHDAGEMLRGTVARASAPPAAAPLPTRRLLAAAPPARAARADLLSLAARMAEVPDGADEPLEQAGFPAGYTYLARVVELDLTFDAGTRAPQLNLDGLYGHGPAAQPYLYADGDAAKLRVDRHGAPRLGDVAVMADARYDDHLLVSQLHGLLARFHNTVVDTVRDEGWPEADVLDEARRRVVWHYQWVVLHDLMPRLCGEDVMHDVLHRASFVVTTGWAPDPALMGLDHHGHPMSSTADVVEPRLRFYDDRGEAFLPAEFALAVARFTDATARAEYALNDDVVCADLRGRRALPEGWHVDWKHFFRLPGEPERPQAARRIDERLGRERPAEARATLYANAFRMLRDGAAAGLPSGQGMARAMGLDPLPDRLLELDDLPRLARETPLPFYVLAEARHLCDGCCLGPVGGRVLAETIVGVLAADPASHLRIEPGWGPTLPFAGDTFRMADLALAAHRS